MNTTFITLYGYHIRMASVAPKGACKGHVVFFHGRAEFIEKYQSFYDFLVARGYHLWIMDWPMHGLSEKAEGKSRKEYVQIFTDYPMIAKAFMEHIQHEYQVHHPHIITHSMAGLVMLRLLQEVPETAASLGKIILCTPLVNIEYPQPMLAPFAKYAMAILSYLGAAKKPIASIFSKDTEHSFEHSRMTNNQQAWQHTRQLMRDNPALRTPLATYGFLYAILQQIELLHKHKYKDLPVITVLQAQQDVIVSNAAMNDFFEHHSKVDIRSYPTKHEILQDGDYHTLWADIMEILTS